MNVGLAIKKGKTLDFNKANFILLINDEYVYNKTPADFPDFKFLTQGDWYFKYKNVECIQPADLYITTIGYFLDNLSLEEAMEQLIEWINTR